MNDPVAATLSVIAEHVERYRQGLAEVGMLQVPAGREDLRAAVAEAEQGLRNAERLLRRALKLTS
jgi:2-keto-3-deoxy-galactonokinase